MKKSKTATQNRRRNDSSQSKKMLSILKASFVGLTVCSVVISGINLCHSAPVQVIKRQVLIGGPGIAVPGGIQKNEEEKENGDKRDKGDVNKFPYGGAVATSTDVDRILAKAERYQKENNYRAASRFWLAALERAPGKMHSEDNELYYPMVQYIESKLAKLPPEGLKVYRIAADAQAEEIIAAGKDQDEMETLQKVVDIAFLSSKGDQSALKLAGLYLDRFQAAEAESLLLRIIDIYPNPDVPLDQVWLKLAIAAYLNDNNTRAYEALEKAKELRSEVSETLIKGVEKMFTQVRSATVSSQTSDGWHSSFGIGQSLQVSPDLPKGYLQPNMAPVWMFQHQLKLTRSGGKYIDGKVVVGQQNVKKIKLKTTKQNDDLMDLAKKWRQRGFRTTATPLVVDGKIIFKTQADLAAWHTDLTKTKAVLRSKKLNRYSTDAVTNYLLKYPQNISNYPSAQGFHFQNPFALQYFGDPLYQSVSVYKGIAYSVEGLAYDRSKTAPTINTNRRGVNPWSSPRLRSRETFLQAYDLKTGKTLWDKSFPDSDPAGAELKEGAVAGPAVGFKDNVLFPYLNGDEMMLISVNRLTGKIKWKCSICYLPEISPNAGTAVQVTIDQQSVYAVCGSGLITSVDVNSGKLRWVRKYKRSVFEKEKNPNARMFGHMNQDRFNKELRGWEHDLAMSWGPWVVVAASDTNCLAAFRKSDGKMIWKAERFGVLGCTVDRWLGCYDGIVYAIGKNSLIAYELGAEGRLFGTPAIIDGNVTGQGFVTKSGVYLPVGDSIQKYDLKTLKKTGEYHVDLPERTVLGSIVSDGKRIWCASLNRLFAIMPAEKTEDEKEPADSETKKTKSADKKTT